MEYTKGKCSCRVILGQHNESGIDYCPLHKAAPDLYEACLSALGIMATLDQEKGWVKEISGVIQQALAKANKE